QGRVDLDLSVIIAKCMKTDPAQRYHSMEEVLRDLKARHEGKPVSPLARNKSYWVGKFAHRHRVPLAIASVAAAVTLFALLSSSHQSKVGAGNVALNYVLRGREFLGKGDQASAVAYFAASNAVSPSLLARGSLLSHLPPVPIRLFPY